MDKQDQIETLKTTIAAIDNAIAQTQAALQSPATTSASVYALRSRLIDLQAQRSELQTELINLQASAVEVQPLAFAAAAGAAAARAPRFSTEQADEIQSVRTKLNKSLTDRSVIRATLQHGAEVSGHASRILTLFRGVHA